MNSSKDQIVFFWFRRDLRLEDNTGLFHALKSGHPVVPVFIFDTDILENLSDKADRRVEFIHRSLQELQQQLISVGSTLLVRHGSPVKVWTHLFEEFPCAGLYFNNDYEPYAVRRDKAVTKLCRSKGVAWFSFKDQVIFEKNQVVKDDSTPYTVFTPYSKRWKALLHQEPPIGFESEALQNGFFRTDTAPLPTLQQIGFRPTGATFPDKTVREAIIRNYHHTRDLPGIEGTTRLGVHLRFGTVSTRQLVQMALIWNETWLNELIWREFYMMILHHFPHVEEKTFRPAYDRIQWKNDPEEFAQWCSGQTGFPMVDAGMRELNETGFMHNRVRMVTASFLTKNLLIDWRWGERYFAKQLLDYDLSANNGNWQWAAGTGCDAAPYFRVFNPAMQLQKFDPDQVYIKKWLSDLGTSDYPAPMVDFYSTRQRAISIYRSALSQD